MMLETQNMLNPKRDGQTMKILPVSVWLGALMNYIASFCGVLPPAIARMV